MSTAQYALVLHREKNAKEPVMISSLSKPEPSHLILLKWQNMLDFVANLFGVAETRITKIKSHGIDTLLVNGKARHRVPSSEAMGVGGLIEGVLASQAPFILEDVKAHQIWSEAGDEAASFMGIPIKWPDNEIFGTLTIKDDKIQNFDQRHQEIVHSFIHMMNMDLALLIETDSFNRRSSYIDSKTHTVKTGICLYDGHGLIISWNESANKILGYSLQDVKGMQVDILFPIGAINSMGHGHIYEVAAKNGDPKSLLIERSEMHGASGEALHVLSFADQTDLINLQRGTGGNLKLDEETGVFNHHSIIDVLDQEAKRALRYKQPLALIAVQIEGYPFLDQLHGSGCCDMVVQTLSIILKNETRDVDIIGRLSEDIFLVVLPSSNEGSAKIVANRIVSIADKFSDKETPFTLRKAFMEVSELVEDWYEKILLLLGR